MQRSHLYVIIWRR